MSRGATGRILVVILGAGLCAAVTGCALSLPGAWLDGNSDGLAAELATDGNGQGVPRAAAEVPVSAVVREREIAAPEAAGQDYRVVTSFSDLGALEIALEGSGGAQDPWVSADAEAAKRCRAWGYEGAAGNAPVNRVRLYRCEKPAVSSRVGGLDQASAALWRTAEFRQVLWNFRGRAQQGDQQAMAMVHGMAAQRDNLAHRAEGRGAKDWTHWMFAVLMASEGEVRGETWQCFAPGRDRRGEPAVMLGRLEEAGAALGVGEVSASGVSHPAVFRTAGAALRWEYGSGPWRELPHAFVIEPDGGGYQIEVSGSAGAQATSRRAFDCQVVR